MNKPCVILNGPASCGKGIVADYLSLALTETFALNPLEMDVISCKTPLYEMLFKFFSITPEEFFKAYNNRDTKEVSHPKLQITGRAYRDLLEYKGTRERRCRPSESKVSISPRDAMIFLSEIVAKPNLGMDCFGVARAKLVEQSTATFVIDDSGAAFEDRKGDLRIDEILPLVNTAGGYDILVVRIYRDGCSFEGDSRRYFPDSVKELGISVINMYNNGSEQEYLQNCSGKIMEFVKNRIKT